MFLTRNSPSLGTKVVATLKRVAVESKVVVKELQKHFNSKKDLSSWQSYFNLGYVYPRSDRYATIVSFSRSPTVFSGITSLCTYLYNSSASSPYASIPYLLFVITSYFNEVVL